MCKFEIKFAHFRVYSEYSLKGIINIKNLIKKVKNDKQESLCISDENSLYNSLRFYKECIKNKIKPIIGCNFNLKISNKKYDIILIVKNYLGYYNILKILSRINIFDKRELDFNIFKGEINKNLFLILNLNHYKKKYFLKKSVKIIKKIKKYFNNNFYLELQRKKNNKNYKKIIELSKITNTSFIITNPVSFIDKKDFFIYKAKIFILKKKDNNNKVFKSNYFYKKKKILKIFNNIKKSLKNNSELSKKCNLIIDFNKIKLPFFRLKSFFNSNNIYLISLLNKKLKKLKFKDKIYKERLKYELKIIIKMQLSDYFLIVGDFISWSKKKGIQVGPGRGSSAGSLVSFLLNITELDPIKYDLLFERFLNSERINMPDFDIDFSPEDREKLIRYIKKKYGINCISQIITFNKMAIKSSIKDIGRFLNFNFDFINEINKIISLNSNLNIIEILKKDKNFYNKYKKSKKIKKLIYLVSNMEGMFKNIGVHAGGFIISPNSNFYYFFLLKHNNTMISGYFKDDIEEIGILKFDFLGLITLSIIKNTLKNIKNIKLNLKKIDLKDKNCYNILKNGNTIGVFQLESKGIRKVLNMVKPNTFKNIAAIISLYRPGPIKLIKDFCLRKLEKKKIIYLDKKLEIVLKETYGIIIYQEQIMKILKIVGNYSLNEADNLRKFISKKNIKDMDKEKNKFIKKSLNNRFSLKKSISIFNLIKEFAKYGFNKSHATAYSLLTYYTLWLKTYYIEYFMSSNMTYYFNDVKKVKIFIDDSIKNNIYILPFNINFSNNEFLALKNKKNKKIRYGFKGILGLGFNTIKSIIKSRKRGYFKSFLDFYRRVDKRIVNFKSIESIICAGGFDSINYNRASLIKKLNLFSKINLKKEHKTDIVKNIFFKKNFFWKFKIKILEEKNSLNFFFLNNINNIYEKKYRIFKKKNSIQSGIIININEKIINNNIIVNVINDYNEELQIRIKKSLFNKNMNIIRKYQFILFKICKLNNFNTITNIINFKKIKC